MSKAFAKLAERFAEMTGDKDVTAISETFEQNAKGVDAVELATKDLLSNFSTLLQPNASARAKFSGPSGVASRLTGGTSSNKYPQQESILADALGKHSNSMESFIDNSTFALTLRDSSEVYRRIGEAREDLDYSVKQNVFEPWVSLQSTQIKEVKDQKVKMEGRRLYYDNLRKKYQRNPEKVSQMDVEQARGKLEETLRQTDASMDAILCSDIDRVAQLKHLIDAQQEYHKKTAELLADLSQTLTRRITEAQPRNSTKPQATLKPPAHSGGSGWGDNVTSGNNFSSSGSNFNQYQPPAPKQSQPSLTNGNGTKQANLIGDFDPWNDASTTTNTQYALPPASNNTNGADPFNLFDIPSSTGPSAFSQNFTQPQVSSAQGKRVKLLFHFDSENPGELDLKEGDIVEKVKDLDEHWYEGEIKDKQTGQTRSGYFPKSYAEQI